MLHSRRVKRKNAGASNRRRDKNYAAGGISAILPAAFLLRRLAQGLSDFGRQSKISVRIFRGVGVLPNKRKADSLSDNERSEIVQKDIPFHCLLILRFGALVPACGEKNSGPVGHRSKITNTVLLRTDDLLDLLDSLLVTFKCIEIFLDGTNFLVCFFFTVLQFAQLISQMLIV